MKNLACVDMFIRTNTSLPHLRALQVPDSVAAASCVDTILS